jgi:hypothetical protein
VVNYYGFEEVNHACFDFLVYASWRMEKGHRRGVGSMIENPTRGLVVSDEDYYVEEEVEECMRLQ